MRRGGHCEGDSTEDVAPPRQKGDAHRRPHQTTPPSRYAVGGQKCMPAPGWCACTREPSSCIVHIVVAHPRSVRVCSSPHIIDMMAVRARSDDGADARGVVARMQHGTPSASCVRRARNTRRRPAPILFLSTCACTPSARRTVAAEQRAAVGKWWTRPARLLLRQTGRLRLPPGSRAFPGVRRGLWSCNQKSRDQGPRVPGAVSTRVSSPAHADGPWFWHAALQPASDAAGDALERASSWRQAGGTPATTPFGISTQRLCGCGPG